MAGTVSWETSTSSIIISDADNDTKIQVEESVDEDIIRFDVGGSEMFKITQNASGEGVIEPKSLNVITGQGAGSMIEESTLGNVIVGYNAGKNTTTGIENVMLGLNAGKNNTIGIYNVMSGSGVGFNNQSGNYNVANGFQALFSSISGNRNIAIGAGAGYNNVSGSDNIIIGYSAGLLNESGSKNVFLGIRAGYNETGSNKLYIENSDSTTPLIYGEFDNDLLRINGTLDINNAFSFPIADGTGGQVLQTDGSGTVRWANMVGSTDNLGNHTATQNMNLSGNFLSNDGGTDGIMLENNGNVTIQASGTVNPRLTFFEYGASVSKMNYIVNELDADNTLPNGSPEPENAKMRFFVTTDGVGYANVLNLQGNGRMGINKSTASAILDIQSPSGTDAVNDGEVLLRFSTDRAWQFEQGGDNASTNLNLRSTVNGKRFNIIDNDNNFVAQFAAIGTGANSNRVGIGKETGSNALEVNGNASKSTAGDWLANSDARLKKNILPLNSEVTLQKLLSLQGVTYEWNDDKTSNTRPLGIQYGFTAQNIQDAYPDLVEEDHLGYLQTAYGTYDAMYVEAIVNGLDLKE